MCSTNKIVNTIPVLKINNRKNNLAFYCQTLGMKNLLEEGAFVSLGDQTKVEKLQLEESPSMRTRKVVGTKKLAKIVIKVANPREIEALLARGSKVDYLYQGDNGYAFEATSPEGDTFLLHSEEDWTTLQRIMIAPAFAPLEDFVGLSQFTIEQIHINVPDEEKAVTFYQEWLGNQPVLTFSQASGADLLTESTQTWDLAVIKFTVEQFDVEALRDLLQGREIFVPKSGKFFLTKDESQIEVWIEAV